MDGFKREWSNRLPPRNGKTGSDWPGQASQTVILPDGQAQSGSSVQACRVLLGLLERAEQARLLFRRMDQVADFAVRTKPDVVVLIDSGDFNHRVARRIRARDPALKIVKYVSPQVWASRPGRAAKMKDFLDRVLCLLPFEPEALKRGSHRLKFHRDVPARFGVIPRFGTSRDVKWFEGMPCYILHLANTYEVGDEVIMDGAIQTNPVPDLSGLPKDGYARMHALLSMDLQETRMHRWRFNMLTGQTTEEDLDDEVTEFSMIDARSPAPITSTCVAPSASARRTSSSMKRLRRPIRSV